MNKRIAHKPRLIAILLATTITAAALKASAQTKIVPATPVAAPSLTFDVVSIKMNKSGASAMKMASPSDSDGVTFTNVPLFRIILYTYRINRFYQAVGLPDWSMTERYDITAKVADADVAAYSKLTREQRMMMFQKVMTDRFKLQSHRELRDAPVYAIVVSKGGTKMKEATPGDTYPNGPKAGNDTISHGVTVFVTGPGQITGQAASVSDLGVTLSDYGRQFIGRDVIDKSGLAKKYDFKLQFTPTQIGSDSDAADSQSQESQAGPAIFTALQEQLGLKLESATAPEEFFIIDHLERPSEN